MAIKDLSDWPDDKVPEWVRRKRERARGEAARRAEHREYFEKHLKLSPEERAKLWGQWEDGD